MEIHKDKRGDMNYKGRIVLYHGKDWQILSLSRDCVHLGRARYYPRAEGMWVEGCKHVPHTQVEGSGREPSWVRNKPSWFKKEHKEWAENFLRQWGLQCFRKGIFNG